MQRSYHADAQERLLRREPTASPSSGRCICYHGTQLRQPLSCLSRPGRKRETIFQSRPAVVAETEACECVCECMSVCYMYAFFKLTSLLYVYLMHVCSQLTSRWSGIKMPYTDRDSSQHESFSHHSRVGNVMSHQCASHLSAPEPFTGLAMELKRRLD